jgi:hypothetical protein
MSFQLEASIVGVSSAAHRCLRLAVTALTVATCPQVMQRPDAAQFSIPKQRSLTLPTGQTVEFIAAERNELIFRIVGQGIWLVATMTAPWNH